MNVYEARQKGIEYCQTEGSDHYKSGKIEPFDLINTIGAYEGFAIGSIIKYAARFPRTRNLDDLKKIADYAHILCGVELAEREKKTAAAVLQSGVKPNEQR